MPVTLYKLQIEQQVMVMLIVIKIILIYFQNDETNIHHKHSNPLAQIVMTTLMIIIMITVVECLFMIEMTRTAQTYNGHMFESSNKL